MDTSKKFKIIIVDDEPALLHSLDFTLRRHHFETVTSKNSQDALSSVKIALDSNNSFDLLITDIQLPGMSGLQLIDDLEQMNISLPSLVITEFVDSNMINGIKQRHISHFLCKPFSTDELLLRVNRILNLY